MRFGYSYSRLFWPNPLTGMVKTEARRLIKEGQVCRNVNGVPTIFNNGHPRYWTGKREWIYGPNSDIPIASFIMTVKGYEDVRQITPASVDREGYTTSYGFLNVWTAMYDKKLWKHHPDHDLDKPSEVLLKVHKRPAKYYDAWVFGIAVEPSSIDIQHPDMKGFDPYAFTIALCKTYPGEADPASYLDYFFEQNTVEDYVPPVKPKRPVKGIEGVL